MAPTIRPISDRALTLSVIGCLLLSPVSIFLLLGVIPGQGPGSLYEAIFLHGMSWLPISLVACPIAAVLFHWLKWRRATWVSILTPAALFGGLVFMIVVSLMTGLGRA